MKHLPRLALTVVLVGALLAWPGRLDAQETPEQWRKADAAGIVKAAESLAEQEGEEAAQARAALAGVVVKRFLKDPEQTTKLSIAQWRAVVGHLLSEIAVDARSLWSKALRKAFVPDSGAMAKLSFTDAVGITTPLVALGDDARSLLAERVSAEANLADMRCQDCVDAVNLLIYPNLDDEATAAAVLLLMRNRVLSSSDAMKQLGLANAGTAIRLLDTRIPADESPKWAKAVVGAFAADAKQLGDLPVAGLRTVCGVLERLKQPGLPELALTWAQQQTSFDEVEPGNLYWLSRSMPRQGDAQEVQRKRLVEHITAMYVGKGAEATRSVNPSTWSQYVTLLGPVMSDEVKAQWLAAVREAFTGDRSASASMSVSERRMVLSIMARLGDKEAASPDAIGKLALEEIAAADLSKLTSSDIYRLARELPKIGTEGTECRRKLIAELNTRFLVTPEATREISTAIWDQYATHLGPVLTEMEKADWVARIHRAYGPATETFSKLPSNERTRVLTILRRLGDTEADSAEARGRYALEELSKAKLTSLTPSDLYRISRDLPTEGEEGKTGRRRIIKHVTTTYVASKGRVQEIDPATWMQLVANLAGEMTDAEKSQWATALRTAYAPSTSVLMAMDSGPRGSIVRVLTGLGDTEIGSPEAVGQRAVMELAAADVSKLAVDDIARLARDLPAKGPDGEKGRRQLIDHVTAAYTKGPEATRQAAPAVWVQYVNHLVADLAEQQRQTWLSAFRKAYAASPDDITKLSVQDRQNVIQVLSRLDGAAADAVQSKAKQAMLELTYIGLNALSPADLTRIGRDLPPDDPESFRGRRQIIEHVSATLMADVNSVRKLTCSGWSQLVSVLKADLTNEERSRWLHGIRGAYVDGEALVALDASGMRSLQTTLTALGDKNTPALLEQWGLGTKDMGLDSGVHTLIWLSREMPQGSPARQRIVSYVNDSLMADPKATATLACSSWRYLVDYLKNDIAASQKTAWAEGLKKAFIESPDLDIKGVGDLVTALHTLGDDSGAALASAWIDRAVAGGRMDAGVEDLMTLARTASRGNSAQMQTILTRLNDLYEARFARGEMSWMECRSVATGWLGAAQTKVAQSWAMRALTQAVGPRSEARVLDAGTVSTLSSILGNAGLGRDARTTDLAMICRRVAALPPAEQAEGWDRCIPDLTHDRRVFKSSGDVAQLRTFISNLDGQASLDAVQVLSSLLDVARDGSVARPSLRRELAAAQLCLASKTQSPDLQKKTADIRTAVENGQPAACLDLCRDLVAGSNLPPSLTDKARHLMALVVLDCPEVGPQEVESCIEAATQASTPLSGEAWDLACRRLLKRVAALPAAERASAWAKGLPRLVSEDAALSAGALAELDQLLTADGSLSTTLLTDLMVTVPDLASMCELQQRRVSAFAASGKWNEAVAAGRFLTALHGVTEEGPCRIVNHQVEMMTKAGMSDDAAATFKRCTCQGAAEGSSPLWAADTMLSEAARAALKDDSKSWSARQRAFLLLWAGEPKDAATAAHQALCAAKLGTRHLCEAYESLAVVLAASGGTLKGLDGFVLWRANGSATPMAESATHGEPLTVLIDCERRVSAVNGGGTYDSLDEAARSDLAAAEVDRWTQRMEAWALAALGGDQVDWGSRIWAMMLDKRPDAQSAEAFVSQLTDRALKTCRRDTVREGLLATADHLTHEAFRKALLHKIARIQYDEGNLKGCLDTLERADQIKTSGPQSDLSDDFMRASALIGLKRFPDAEALLNQLSAVTAATAEDRAKALFLVGWIRLQEEKRDEALEIFRRVEKEYPQTSLAPRAKRLVFSLIGE